MLDTPNGRAQFEETARMYLNEGLTAWEAPVRGLFRDLSTVDIDNMYVMSRLDWTSVDLSFEARMQRGATYVRTFYPYGRVRINPRSLDITCGCSCVLGQLWGDFERSLEWWMYGTAWAKAHGLWPLGDDNAEMVRDGARLTNHWSGLIESWVNEALR